MIIPQGCAAGQHFRVAAPDGTLIDCVVPFGYGPGMETYMALPPRLSAPLVQVAGPQNAHRVGAPPPPPTVPWVCSQCTLENVSGASVCAACAGPGPVPPPAPRVEVPPVWDVVDTRNGAREQLGAPQRGARARTVAAAASEQQGAPIVAAPVAPPEEMPVPEGLYDPAKYAVSAEIKELFQHITRYKAHNIELETRMRPFIPDYIPAVGDIDPFIKIPRPDGKKDNLGLVTLDEPASVQSDPTVLTLLLDVSCPLLPWSCSACTYENVDGARDCEMCGTPRPSCGPPPPRATDPFPSSAARTQPPPQHDDDEAGVGMAYGFATLPPREETEEEPEPSAATRADVAALPVEKSTKSNFVETPKLVSLRFRIAPNEEEQKWAWVYFDVAVNEEKTASEIDAPKQSAR